MKLFTLLSHVAELVRITEKSPSAPDKIVSQYFRSKKYIGSKERKFISGLVFANLRILLLVRELSKQFEIYQTDKSIVSIWNSAITFFISFSFKDNFNFGFNPETALDASPGENISLNKKYLAEILAEKFSESDSNVNVQFIINEFDSCSRKLQELRNLENIDIHSLSTLFSFPEWMLEKINTGYTSKSMRDVLSASILPAEVTLRAEPNKATRENAVTELEKLGFQCVETSISPSGIKLLTRAKIDDSDLYKRGLIEVQDESSQLVSFALAPKPGESVLDACAGAGGKSLHIASLMNNKGEIISCDVESHKLNELRKRASRCGYDIISTYTVGAKMPKPLAGRKFDRILVDAPCSGSGTIRRDPTRKYKLTQRVIEKFASRQKEILSFYSEFVRVGGVLVYATCSMFRDENIEVAESFLASHPEFEPYPFGEDFHNYGIGLSLAENDYSLAVTPDMFGSDGFFMARFSRAE